MHRKHCLTVANAETGEITTIVIKAPTRKDAEAAAADLGLLIASTSKANSRFPKWLSSKLARSACLASLLAVIYLVVFVFYPLISVNCYVQRQDLTDSAVRDVDAFILDYYINQSSANSIKESSALILSEFNFFSNKEQAVAGGFRNNLIQTIFIDNGEKPEVVTIKDSAALSDAVESGKLQRRTLLKSLDASFKANLDTTWLEVLSLFEDAPRNFIPLRNPHDLRRYISTAKDNRETAFFAAISDAAIAHSKTDKNGNCNFRGLPRRKLLVVAYIKREQGNMLWVIPVEPGTFGKKVLLNQNFEYAF